MRRRCDKARVLLAVGYCENGLPMLPVWSVQAMVRYGLVPFESMQQSMRRSAPMAKVSAFLRERPVRRRCVVGGILFGSAVLCVFGWWKQNH